MRESVKTGRNALGYFPELGIKWTPQALMCYQNRMMCRKCTVKQILRDKECRMKPIVLEIIKRYGVPNGKEQIQWV